MRFCPRCGNQHPEDASFCSKCGLELARVGAAPTSVVRESVAAMPPASSGEAGPSVVGFSEEVAGDSEDASSRVAVPKAAIVVAWVTIAVSVLAALYSTLVSTGFPNPGVLSFLLPSGYSYSGSGLSGWLSVVFGWLVMFAVIIASVRVILSRTRGSLTSPDSAMRWYDRKDVLAWSPLVAASSWLLLVVLVLAMPGFDSYLTPWWLVKILVNPLNWSILPGALIGIAVFWALVGMGVATGLLIMRAPNRASGVSVDDASVHSRHGGQVNIDTTAIPSTHPFAIASLVLSLVGIVVSISAILGVIFGHIALSQIKRSGQRGRGMALAGVIVGWTMIALSIMFVLFVLNIFS